MKKDSNYSIHCTVEDCRYHCNKENYCSLDCVNIGSHEKNPVSERGVDCKSFECRSMEG